MKIVVNHHQFINITNMFVCTKGVKLSTKKSKVKIMGELKSVCEFSEGRIIKMPHSVTCF